MNWKLIFSLSLFGLAMAIATVYWIPSNIEPVFWLAIFIFSAWRIAKSVPANYFAHGFMVSLVNCFWITTVHILLIQSYAASHSAEMAMFNDHKMFWHGNPRRQMVVMGPIIGIVCGLILGLFAFIASKMMKKTATA